MLDTMLSDDIFVDMMKVHVNEVVAFLIEESVEFTILANMQGVGFEPPLPNEMMKKFRPVMPFVLKNYTFESSSVDEKNLYFEAGFGEENRGAYVAVELEAILQIIVEDTPILINMSVRADEEMQIEEEEDMDKMDKSMKALLSNPKNRKLFED